MKKKPLCIIIAGPNGAGKTTLSGIAYAKRILYWKSVGYRIEIIFLRLNKPNLALKRIRNRVIQGGHNVPKVDVERRFKRSWDNFVNNYQKLASSWIIYDNSKERPVLLEKSL